MALSRDGSVMTTGWNNVGASVFALTDIGWASRGDATGLSGDANVADLSLSGDGSIIAIGRPTMNGNRGEVQISKWDGSTQEWQQIGSTISGNLESDFFGHRVALSADGNTVAVGAPYNGAIGGYVGIYAFENQEWIQRGQTITGESIGDEFGFSISISIDGQLLAAGGRWNEGGGVRAGHVRVFQFSSPNWIQVGQDIDGDAEDSFGGTVSLAGNGRFFVGGGAHTTSTTRVYKIT